MKFFQLLNLLLCYFFSIVRLFCSVFYCSNHGIMSLSGLIQLRFQLGILNFFKFNLLLEDGYFLFKSIFNALDFLFFLFDTAFKFFFSLSVEFFSILKLKLKTFNLRSALALQVIHAFLHFIVLALTHGHIVLQWCLIFLPFLLFKGIFLFYVFKWTL